jgi:hypothetical protein
MKKILNKIPQKDRIYYVIAILGGGIQILTLMFI